MARVEDARGLRLDDDDDDDDDLFEVLPSHPNTIENLLRGPPRLPRPHLNGASAAARNANSRAASVIDLTEESDSPPQARPQGRNPRRTASQRLSPPGFLRSDGTFMEVPFIDLTAEPEYEPLRPRFPRAARDRPPQPRYHDELIHLDMLEDRPRGAGGLAGLAGHFAGDIAGRLTNMIRRDIMRSGLGNPHLDITRNSFPLPQRPPSPKPAMEAPPPTKVGFTRGTRAESEDGADEMVVVCPACNEELAYDPAGTPIKTGAAGKKRKRAPGEHHFWAIKKCGHVYCADCFENRRPTKSTSGAGFPKMGATDLRCVVDGCDSKVTNKTEWVGIFL